MTTPCLATLPLAGLDRVSRLDAIRQGFIRESPDPSATYILALLVVAVAVCGMVGIMAQIVERRRRIGDGAEYLRRGCRVLGLTRSDARDLEFIAKRAGLTHPASMLLSPANLASATARAVPSGHRLRSRMNRVSLQLFDTPLPGVPATSP